MESGKYKCVDEAMNQWLGKGLPNLKKAPRRPHSIGQEYKTIADNVTCIILRLNFCGDPVHRVSARREDRTIVAGVKRLTVLYAKPTFTSMCLKTTCTSGSTQTNTWTHSVCLDKLHSLSL